MTNATSTSTSTAPLTGPALLAFNHTHNNRRTDSAERARLANYITPEGSPDRSGYWQTVINARQDAPVRFVLLTVTDASGQPVGAAHPLPIGHPAEQQHYNVGHADQPDYVEAEAWIKNHADAYADAAQGPDAFPLIVSLSDRAGTVSLFEINRETWQRNDGTATESVTLTDELGDGLIRCDHCGEIHNDDSSETVRVQHRRRYGFEYETWCPGCVEEDATLCSDCSTYYENDSIHTDQSGESICSECADQSYYTCSDCGELCHNDTHNTVDGCDSVCDRCIDRGSYYYDDNAGQWSTEPPDDNDDSAQGPDGMKRYGYHTDANATLRHRIPGTGQTYGAEMEYKGDPDNWAAVAAACRSRAILTNDGTVSGELVSVALTAGQLRRWLAATADALAGSRNDSETGMHFHIDRRALTPWQWHTISHYAAQHAATFEAIAGRQPNQWQDLNRLPASDWPTFARNWKNRCWPTRYAGFNLTKGPTVEVRICRATKTKSRALARFGMVQRMVALGRLAPSQRPQSAEELRGWLAQDANIRAVTGWEPGPYNYKEACQRPMVEGDEQPTPPNPEAIQSLQDRIRRLQNDLNLTDQLRYNARQRYRNAPDGDQTYERSAQTVWEHYRRETDRIGALLNQARTELDCAQSLASIGTLTR